MVKFTLIHPEMALILGYSITSGLGHKPSFYVKVLDPLL
jgi:hypothetical protein